MTPVPFLPYERSYGRGRSVCDAFSFLTHNMNRILNPSSESLVSLSIIIKCQIKI